MIIVIFYMLDNKITVSDELMVFTGVKLKECPKLFTLPVLNHLSYDGVMKSLCQTKAAGRFLSPLDEKIYTAVTGIYDISLILEGRDPDTVNAEGQ